MYTQTNTVRNESSKVTEGFMSPEVTPIVPREIRSWIDGPVVIEDGGSGGSHPRECGLRNSKGVEVDCSKGQEG